MTIDEACELIGKVNATEWLGKSPETILIRGCESIRDEITFDLVELKTGWNNGIAPRAYIPIPMPLEFNYRLKEVKREPVDGTDRMFTLTDITASVDK